MARIRTIKPDFFKNEPLAELPPLTRLLFIGLWTLADRAGRLEDRPKRIRAEVFPYETNFPVDESLQALHDCGFIHRYQVDQQAYIQIVTFARHQNPHVKEAASVIPVCTSTVQAPCKPGANTLLAGQLQVHLQVGEQLQVGEGNGEPVQEPSPSSPPAEVDRFEKKGAFSVEAEIATWPDDQPLREAFAMVRKIPDDHYPRYIREFTADLAATGKPPRDRQDLRKHFLNWSEIHHRVETKPATGRGGKGGGEKNAPLDRAAVTIQVGQIADRFTEKTWKWIFGNGEPISESAIRERAERAKTQARERFLTPPARSTGGDILPISQLLPAPIA